MNTRRAMILAAICVVAVSAVAVGVFTSTNMDDAQVDSNSENATVTVTYNSNGSIVGANESVDIIKTFTYDAHSSVELADYDEIRSWTWGPTTGSTKTSADFLGWATEHEGPVVYPASTQPVFVQDITTDLKLYTVWAKVNVTVHQPTEYGQIQIKKYNDSTYYQPSNMFQVVTCKELSLKFVPKTSETVNYWVINGVKSFYGLSEIQISVYGITEISLYVDGQATDIYALSNGFKAVEYIENTTGAVIDTGVNPDYLTKTDVVFYTVLDSYGSTSGLFGVRANYLKNTYAFWERTANATSMRSDYGVMGKEITDTLSYHTKYHIVKDGANTTITYSTKEKTNTMASMEFYTPSTMYIFCIAEGTKVIGPSMPIRLYSFTIQEGDVTLRNYIPCKYSGESGKYYDSKGKPIQDGDVGLFDTIYGIFYRNIGTADSYFTAGEEVHTYTMGFNQNNGKGGQNVFTYSSLSELETKTVSIPTSPEGYVFYGYYLTETPVQTWSTKVYDAEGHYVIDSLSEAGNYVMEAKWTPVNVRYYKNYDRDPGKGDIMWEMQSQPASQAFILLDPPDDSPAGYTFVCWSTMDGTSYYNGESVYFSRDVDLYGTWVKETERTIKYNYNDDLGRSFKVVEKDAEVTIASGPVREGYVFHNWNTKVDGTGATYNAGVSYTIDDNLDLYAQWEYNVSFDKNGGSGGLESITFVGHVMPNIVVSNLPTKTGATFYGYVDSDDCLYYNSQGEPQLNWDNPDGTKLYAVWTYTVILDLGDECSFSETPEGWTHEGGYYTKGFQGYKSTYATITSAIPTVPEGYIFVGWDSDGIHVASGGSINILVATTFVPKYVKASYTGTLES